MLGLTLLSARLHWCLSPNKERLFFSAVSHINICVFFINVMFTIIKLAVKSVSREQIHSYKKEAAFIWKSNIFVPCYRDTSRWKLLKKKRKIWKCVICYSEWTYPVKFDFPRLYILILHTTFIVCGTENISELSMIWNGGEQSGRRNRQIYLARIETRAFCTLPFPSNPGVSLAFRHGPLLPSCPLPSQRTPPLPYLPSPTLSSLPTLSPHRVCRQVPLDLPWPLSTWNPGGPPASEHWGPLLGTWRFLSQCAWYGPDTEYRERKNGIKKE